MKDSEHEELIETEEEREEADKEADKLLECVESSGGS